MSRTPIEWVVAVADAIGGLPEAWNPVVGCSRKSKGCKGCYAERLAATRLKTSDAYAGLAVMTDAGPRWTGETRVLPDRIDAPLRWRGRRAVFVCDMGDLFHETVDDDFLDAVFAVMERRPDCIFMLLTKREDRLEAYYARRYTANDNEPPAHIWAGVSVEDRETMAERLPALERTRAAVKFLSCEPLLEDIDLSPWLAAGVVDWVIVGGESGSFKGHVARPVHPKWVRSLREQCRVHGVSFFFKQWGDWLPDFETPGEMFEDDPEQSRFATCVWDVGAGRWEETNGAWDDPDQWCIANDYWEDEQPMTRVGKGRAGRFLEGEVYSAVPDQACREISA